MLKFKICGRLCFVPFLSYFGQISGKNFAHFAKILHPRTQGLRSS